jgi:hypothetical protein
MKHIAQGSEKSPPQTPLPNSSLPTVEVRNFPLGPSEAAGMCEQVSNDGFGDDCARMAIAKTGRFDNR